MFSHIQKAGFLITRLISLLLSQVDFDEFKDSFVTILCQTTVDEPLSEEESDGEEVSGADSEGQEEGETGQEDTGQIILAVS